ncbi:MAG TPA: dickkopf-related protein, partial [Polyangiaceae bacterium]|nr:dickkopf-related protein [Polyangiaceae bacterium]
MGIFRFLGLGLGLVTVAGFAGCSSDEHATRGLASGCTINTDCAAPLVCAFQRCHQQCTSTRDCSGGLTCVTSNGAGVCQFEDESTCARDADCGSGQVCAGGACRAGCRDSSACLASQDCVDGVCEDVAVDGGGGSGGSSGGSGGSAGASGAGGEAADASTDAGPPPECHLATLATDCPSNECRQATTCSLDGKCVYSPLAPATCGTCDLGKPSCADPSAPACGDIEVLGLAGAEVNCDSTSPDATFVFVDPTYTGPSPSGSRTAPFVDLAAALTAASRPGRGATTVVIAGSPVYTSTLVVPDGVSIRGGYSATDDTGAFTGVWRRDLSRRPIWNIGPASLGDHVLVGLRAEHVHRTSIVADVTVVTQAIGGASAD